MKRLLLFILLTSIILQGCTTDGGEFDGGKTALLVGVIIFFIWASVHT